MCNTYLHMQDDDALVALVAADLANPAAFNAVRTHRYGDECCRVERGGDMNVRYKRYREPWLPSAEFRSAYPEYAHPTWVSRYE